MLLYSSLCLVPSLNQVRRDYNLPDSYLEFYLKPLLDSGIICELDDVDNQVFTLFQKASIHVFEKVLFSVFQIDGLKGHCFIYLTELNLFIYPHEDIGFGFISADSFPDGAEAAQDIIESLNINSVYDVKLKC